MSIQHQTSDAVSPALENWPGYLDDLHTRISHRFRRPEVGERVRRYLVGLLGDARRKNGWQMAESMGEYGPRGTQRVLGGSLWDANEVRDDLREYVAEHLGDEESGVLIVDETGFLKKGEKSVGVARQYTGTAGKRENSQVGVFLCYSSDKGAAFIDRALYLPREWTNDRKRLSEAGVPEGVGFATKGELAKRMLERAFEAGVAKLTQWVVADTVYGMSRGLRGWLEKREISYVLAVTSSKGVYHEGRQRRASEVARLLPGEEWLRVSAGEGSKGERLYDWACVSLPDDESYIAGSAAGRWLLMRRSIVDPEEIAYYLCYGSARTGASELIRIAGRRWQIEDSFAQAKGETGLDEYEVRKWDGWQRHITLCLLAHAYLAVIRSVAADEEEAAKKGISAQVLIPS